jgi:hypothetical protein
MRFGCERGGAGRNLRTCRERRGAGGCAQVRIEVEDGERDWEGEDEGANHEDRDEDRDAPDDDGVQEEREQDEEKYPGTRAEVPGHAGVRLPHRPVVLHLHRLGAAALLTRATQGAGE